MLPAPPLSLFSLRHYAIYAILRRVAGAASRTLQIRLFAARRHFTPLIDEFSIAPMMRCAPPRTP